MLRIGLTFINLHRRHENQLDRYVFRMMRRRSREYRHVGSGLFGSRRRQERRRTMRVQLSKEASLTAKVSDLRSPEDPPPDTSKLAGLELKLFDISATGCSLICPDFIGLNVGSTCRLTITGDNFQLETAAKIVYAAII